MNLSGILVTADPARLDEISARLRAIPGIDVHPGDPRSGAIILVQESTSLADETAGFMQICRVPGVTSAHLVFHYLGDDSDCPAGSAGR